MRRRIILTVTAVILTLLIGAAATGTYLLLTTSGSGAVVKFAIARYVRAANITIGGIEGNLVEGLTFHDVVIDDISRFPDGSIINLEQLHVILSASDLRQSRIEVSHASFSIPGLVEWVSLDKATGSLTEGFSLYEAEATDITRLPAGSVLAVQRVDMSDLPRTSIRNFKQAGVKVNNGRLRLPHSEPILFYGKYLNGNIDAHFYSRIVDPEEILEMFPNPQHVRAGTGTVSDINLHVIGAVLEPEATGNFLVDKLTRRGFTMAHCPVVFTVRLKDFGRDFKVYGELMFEGGVVSAKQTAIALEPSTIEFSGNPKVPIFNVKGVSVVQGTRIHIALTGNRFVPDLKLTASPPASEGRLLAMLATGESWGGAEAAVREGQIAPDLAKDFIDYFIFGGLGSKLARSLGISDVSLLYDPETNRMGVSTTIADRVEVTYETEQPKPNQASTTASTTEQQAPGTYKVGAGYKITEGTTVKIEGEREFAQPTKEPTATTQPGQTGTTSQPRESIFLKLERKF